MKRTMFYGASRLIFLKAKDLRNKVTNAEMILWEYLRTKPFGYKFRRQHPIGIFIADFYCHRLKLVIELDGSVHNQPEIKLHDEERQKIIELEGMKVLRFRNKETIIGSINTILNGSRNNNDNISADPK